MKTIQKVSISILASLLAGIAAPASAKCPFEGKFHLENSPIVRTATEEKIFPFLAGENSKWWWRCKKQDESRRWNLHYEYKQPHRFLPSVTTVTDEKPSFQIVEEEGKLFFIKNGKRDRIIMTN